jgi:glycerol-3-phosphate dehydrogenase (NAD(P)+)
VIAVDWSDESAAGRPRVAVVGAGSWGSAFAFAQAVHGSRVSLCARREAQAQTAVSTAANGSNSHLIRGELVACALTESAVADAELIVLAVPSWSLCDVLQQILPTTSVPLISLAKGLSRTDGARLSEAVERRFGIDAANRFSVLSGPNPARSVADAVPTRALVAACSDTVRTRVVGALSGPLIWIDECHDLVGLEYYAALKNVAAVLLGVAHGLGLGGHDQGRILARSAVEISRLVIAFGGSPETCVSAAGIEDLIETALGGKSRSFRAGESLGRGAPHEPSGPTASRIEGFESALGVAELLRRRAVFAPLLEFSGRLAAGAASPHEIMDAWRAGHGPTNSEPHVSGSVELRPA